MGDLVFTCHVPPGDVERMTTREIFWWHQTAREHFERLNKGK